jgi:hypothetical protein
VGEVGLLQRLRGEAAPLICATNGVPLSYELTPANVAEVRLTEELLAEAHLGDDLARKLLGDDLAYRSEALGRALAECGIRLVTERADQHGLRQRIERYRPFEPQAGVRVGRDAGDDLGGVRYQDRGEDLRLHTYGFCTSTGCSGQATGTHQGTVGVKTSQHTSREGLGS